jgi:hypothetical protein
MVPTAPLILLPLGLTVAILRSSAAFIAELVTAVKHDFAPESIAVWRKGRRLGDHFQEIAFWEQNRF